MAGRIPPCARVLSGVAGHDSSPDRTFRTVRGANADGGPEGPPWRRPAPRPGRYWAPAPDDGAAPPPSGLCGAGVPAASPHPARASTPTAANIESGTAMAPRPLALAIVGLAPERRAASSHRSQANEPVTNRLGPRLSPIKRAKG